MKDVYPIPKFILDAYDSCTVNWEAKQIKFPRRQFADALERSGHVQDAENWFNQVAKETGLKLNANEIFQICIRHHLTEYKPAKCPTCGKLLPLNSVKIGVQFCSVRCSQLDPEIKAKVQNTIKERYGEKGLGSDVIQAKTRATVQAKYGVNSVLQAKEVREKIKQTTLERYGVENVYAAEEIKEKIRKTNLERYGTAVAAQSPIIRQKLRETVKKKYGGNAPMCSEEVRAKVRQTNLERYGATSVGKVSSIREKIRQTNQAKYGGNAPICSDEIKHKVNQTSLEKYGVKNAIESPEVREKIIRTRKENYYPVFLELLKRKNIEYLSTKEDYINRATLKFRCGYCSTEWVRDYELSPTAGTNGIACPHCIKTRISKVEKDLLDYITSLYPGIIIPNDRKLIKPYELDIYLPEKRLAFEFDGTYWHSDQVVPKGYHIKKTRLCSKQRARLIHIFEHEWTFNQEKIKSLIKSALGIFDVRLYARKCTIKEISSTEYKEFLELYHLQGSVNSSIRYGLFYNNELVSVIGFGKSRFKQGEIELHRYCVKAGYQIVGGFSKLITHACTNADISEFISYIDLAHFNGRGYKKAGFKLLEVTQPSYIYIKGDEIKSRMQCQKHKLEAFLEEYDPNLSEYENMLLNGWDRVYDCGNMKVKYNFSHCMSAHVKDMLPKHIS